ncbi:hypothetical protein ACF3DV_28440 [Chlorogloeopsis fritschii PCC 9212]|uniref:hypothetical protein n=1 Tax=Chlorogloeopsis fritschii TaxID=1124 RepID=UPI000317F088|nr:hypothetical protein [Chlorogloeopsis fritschii]
MRKKPYFLICVATNLLMALTNQSAMAFSLKFGKGAISYYNPTEPYVIDANTSGTTFLSPRYVAPIKLGGTNDFLKMLNDDVRWRGWDFIPSDKNLYGNFEILYYYACGAQTLCAKEEPKSDNHIRGGVGAYINIKYNPQKTDPKPEQAKIHWIQRVVNNHSLYNEHQIHIDGGTHDLRYDGIDIPIWMNVNPYYDTVGTANESSFRDKSYRIDANNPHFWVGELYLVEEIAPQTVKIYNGVRWGWINRVYRRRNILCPAKSISSDDNCTYEFSDSLSSGTEVDSFKLPGFTPGKRFTARIDNDIPGNRCNPNTYLTASDNSGYISNFDDNSSPLGDGFASALKGSVSSDGTINLDVRAANGGRRGEDRGNYKLYVELYEEGEFLPEADEFIVGSSGGGGFGAEIEIPGRTQDDPILPDEREGNWQLFRNVPGCRWYDPHTTYGFEFQALDDTLFTEILDFPIGDDNRFTVSVGDTIVGEFSPGESLDFVSLFGHGISNFKITDIDSLFGSTQETAFPIQLAFNDRIGSFKMRPISKESSPQSVPEYSSVFGLLAVGAWSIVKALKIRSNKQQ